MAYWALQHGLGPHDVVSLMMDNRPEFIITWLGLAKVGVTCALINTNVRGQPLVHSIEQCQPVAFIVGAELLHTVSDVRHQLPPSLRLFSHGKPADGFVELTTELDALAARPLPPSALSFASQRVGLTSSSLLFYIFTSGTTGLPKAARIRHSRFYLGSVSFSTFFHLRASDRLYSALPLYHSVGGILAVGMSWHCGGSLVLRRRFSASAFFQDCYEQDVTVVMYIGQLCKYLMHTPVSAYEERHRVRIAIGNGMPADIWEAFQRRFHIADIGEFYASTEGNANLVNNRNRPGAIGYIPWIATFIYPVRVVAFDYSTEQPVRDPTTGLCREASEGELLGKLSSDPLRAFDGYTSSAATSEKVLTSVFHPHDQWFRTGDLVRRDEEGYIFFVDRIGDTYRWKGENCATTEVERVLSAWPGVKEVNVYGVKVGGHDGKAGMAAIVLHDDTGGDTAAPVTHTAIDLQLFYESTQPHTHSAPPSSTLTATGRWLTVGLSVCACVSPQLPSDAAARVPAAAVPPPAEGDGQRLPTAR